MRILCCSFPISPQTHRSLGSPHIGQISAMMLNTTIPAAVYKIFKFQIHFSPGFGKPLMILKASL
jgi:hypothetical protein